MFLQKKTINNVPQFIHLTADTGTGAPVGSYLYLEKKSNPQGYLYCDGSTFDETAYPALYQYLGTNVLPDWRELGAKGAEKNTTLIFDSTETDPRTGQAGTQNHDVFTQGEFKDDQLQDHKHEIWDTGFGQGISSAPGSSVSCLLNNFNTGANSNRYKATTINGARTGTVTRGKSRAVFIYIKATSGLTENQQENVLNTINENNSYSTTEHKTGKKWIDGKDIYRKVVEINSATASASSQSFPHGVTGLEKIITLYGNCVISNRERIFPYFDNENKCFVVYYDSTNIVIFFGYSTTSLKIVIEYTKTTDN